MAHVALGHASPSRIKTYLERNANAKISTNKIKEAIKNCVCRQIDVPKKHGSKHKAKSEYTFGEVIHMDIIGPIDHKYAILGTDRASNYVVSKILTSREQVTDATISIIKHLSNLLQISNLLPCFIRADNEFRTRKLREFCSTHGIIIKNTAPYSSYQNGTAEVVNKIIQYKKRKLLHGGNVPKQYWTYAFNHAVFNTNKNPDNNKTINSNSSTSKPKKSSTKIISNDNLTGVELRLSLYGYPLKKMFVLC